MCIPFPPCLIYSSFFFHFQITLGDAIVCWRACVVWYHNRFVRAVLGALLLATAGKPHLAYPPLRLSPPYSPTPYLVTTGR